MYNSNLLEEVTHHGHNTDNDAFMEKNVKVHSYNVVEGVDTIVITYFPGKLS